MMQTWTSHWLYTRKILHGPGAEQCSCNKTKGDYERDYESDYESDYEGDYVGDYGG